MTEPERLFIATPPGLERVTEAEVGEILSAGGFHAEAGRAVRGVGGIEVAGGERLKATLLLHLSTASRVLVRIGSFRARGFPELERRLSSISLDAVRAGDRPVRLEVTSKKSRLYHTGAIEERIRRVLQLGDPSPGEDLDVEDEVDAEAAANARDGVDAVAGVDAAGVEAARSASSRIRSEGEPIRIVVRVHRDQFTLSADASGRGLHRRGYRLATAKAPMRETLAAALIRVSGWTPDQPFADPFCGSGTLPIEAARMARRIPAGMDRSFDAELWPSADGGVWEEVRSRARGQILESAPAPIAASDRDAGAVSATRANAERAGVLADLSVTEAAFSDAQVPAGAWVLMNPPYGHRVGGGDLRNLYGKLGSKLLEWNAAGIALVTDEPDLLRHTGFDGEIRFRTSNGGIDIGAVSAVIPQRR